MTISNGKDKKVERRPRGWNLRALKGKKKDKDSPEFQNWLKKQRASRNRTTRRKLEELAKAPLPAKDYKHHSTL